MGRKTWTGAVRIATAVGAAALLCSAQCEDGDVGEGDTFAQTTVRLSVRRFGEEVDAFSGHATISADGRFVAFHSDAATLVPGASNGLRDVFLKDRASGEVTLISETENDDPEFGSSPADRTDPYLSGSGRYVAFVSREQLVGGPLPAPGRTTDNAFVYDRVTGSKARVIDLPIVDWPDADLEDVSVSDDGQSVCFRSAAANLGFGDPGGDAQVYVVDLSVPTITLISDSTAGGVQFCNGPCSRPEISADGQWVVFESTATDLNAGDADALGDIFIAPAAGGAVELVSVDTGGTKGDSFSEHPAVSADGRFVAFQTYATNLAPGAGSPYLLVRDRTAATTTLAAERVYDIGFVFPSTDPCDVSDDGRFVAYKTRENPPQIRVADVAGGDALASRHLDGTPADAACNDAQISGDGRWVLWSIDAGNLVDDDFNSISDVYLRGPYR